MLLKYPHSNRVLVATDCIIFGFDGEELKLLVIKRNFEPEQGKWSLMGGFLNENEDLEVGAKRILHELTGLENVYMEQLHTFGEVKRDPVERTVSVSFYALINISDHDAELARSKNAYWQSLETMPDLIFDHGRMVQMALQRLRYKAALHPIGFELLPEKFTIPQLQRLYEAIYSQAFDRRNFSRKILSTKLLKDTGEKNEQSLTKKAILYRLDQERYQKQFNAFIHFISDF
ncbi:NUDIX hydrolase [Siphonobacter curvatus]|uniref:DNA mismatch repair protein MutT n=1 Tax=Siphonobacter curvatus TaxID=2094562 RepID=A0A2S7IM06_9BACT|nr:NUDIX domain-containing protein [Siphonobacter curvatus]PQA58590.1 DNA mismatch repair protein MutT [Siphonobacter curvatus]